MQKVAPQTIQEIKELAFGQTPYYPFDKPLRDSSDPENPLPLNEEGQPVEWDIGTFLIHCVTIVTAIDKCSDSPETLKKAAKQFINFQKFLRLSEPFERDFKTHIMHNWPNTDISRRCFAVIQEIKKTGYIEMRGALAYGKLKAGFFNLNY